MEFSKSYYIRQEKLKLLEVPTFSEIREQLGEKLSDIIIKTCPESLQQDMAVEPKLNGPGKELWVSPSDLLISKVVLKPPLTNKHTKALTHQGILQIGSQMEEKVLKDLREQYIKELLEKENTLTFIAEHEKNQAIAETVRKQEEIFSNKIMQVQKEFEDLLEEELAKFEAHLKIVLDELTQVKKSNSIFQENELKYENDKKYTQTLMKDLTSQFFSDLESQEQNLTNIFNKKLEKQGAKYTNLLKNEKEVFKIMLKQLKHNLQCNNIANLMYTLCLERRKQIIDRNLLIQFYSEKVEELQNKCDKLDKKVEQLTKFKDEKIKDCEIREEFLKVILKEFQKMINFALRASPKQAEFLLNIKKMMTFELAEIITKKSVPFKENLMPWKQEINDEFEEFTNIAEDYHNCINVKEVESKTPSLDESLRAFTLSNKYLYIREDFRNKMLNTVKPNSMIWNKDADNLIILMKTIKSNTTINTRKLSHTSGRSSVHFNALEENLSPIPSSIGRQESINLGLLAAKDSFEVQKNVTSSPTNIITPENLSYLTILAANDSLEVLKNSESSRTKLKSTNRIVSTDTIQLSEKRNRHTEIIEAETFCLNPDSSSKKTSCETIKLSQVQSINLTKSSPNPSIASKKTTLKNFKNVKTKYQHFQQKSLLNFHRDSLEILRNSKSTFKQITEVPSLDAKPKVYNSVINIPQENQLLDVNFSRIATVFNEVSKLDMPWLKNKVSTVSLIETAERTHSFEKNVETAKIIGETGKEHLQCIDSFTKNRIHSLVNILKKDNSLIRIFTAGSQ